MMADSINSSYNDGYHNSVDSNATVLTAIFIYPIWTKFEKHLRYPDLINLSSVNRFTRMSIYSLCTHLRLNNPHYFLRNGPEHDYDSPDFVLNKYTSLTSLTVTPSIMNCHFLKHTNLSNLKQISLTSKYFSVAQPYLPMLLTDLHIYRVGLENNTYNVLFKNIDAFKNLLKLNVFWEHLNERGLYLLPDSLQYLNLVPSHFNDCYYNFDISHMVNLKEFHCIFNNCFRIKLPCNLEKLHLRGFSGMQIQNLNMSYLSKLKVLEYKESDIADIILPSNLEEIKISTCCNLTRLSISNVINLKKMKCSNNAKLIALHLPFNNLEKVIISNCKILENINISHLINLKTLELKLLLNLKTLILPPSLTDIFIQYCNILIINEKDIIFDSGRPQTQLFSHTIKIGKRWVLTDYKVTPWLC